MKDQILSIIRNELKNNDITCDFNLNNNWDSLSFIKILVAIEGTYEIEFDDDMLLLTAFPTVQSLIDYVTFKVGNPNI